MRKYFKLKHFFYIIFISSIIALVGLSLLVSRVASETTYYFNGAVDNDWNNLGNWWNDAGFITPAGSLPTVSDNVIASANISSNGGPAASVNNFTMNGSGNILYVGITVADHATFDSGTGNEAEIIGNTIFNNATNSGVVTGTAEFNGNSSNGGTVNGNATFNDNSDTYANITGDVVFNGHSSNDGWIVGNVTFNDSSVHSSGTITGNATFNGDVSDIPYGSSISGTKTRRYTSSLSTTRNFTVNGPWTVVAEGTGVVVDVSGATYNDATVFSELSTGSFQYTTPAPADNDVETQPSYRSGGGRGFVTTYTGSSTTTSITTVDFGCEQGNQFSTVTGKACPIISNEGCAQGNNYNVLTGVSCSGDTLNESTSGQLFLADLQFGVQKSDDVQRLQQFLNQHGFLIASIGPGSPGDETKYFGKATKDALIRFQIENNIKPSIGFFGPVTRGVVNAIISK